MSSGDTAHIIVLTALKLERDAVLARLPPARPVEGSALDARHVSFAAPGGATIEVVVLCVHGMGNLRAAVQTTRAMYAWSSPLVILAGIAGGISGKNRRLGDVVVAEQIVYYELAEQREGELVQRSQVYRPPAHLLAVARQIESAAWVGAVTCPRPDDTAEPPQCHVAVVLSGEKVVKDAAQIEALRKQSSQAIAIEMEAGGASAAVYEVGGQSGVLLVKSICDWADSQKSDVWQPYAAATSAAFVAALLDSLSRRHLVDSSAPLGPRPTPPSSTTGSLVPPRPGLLIGREQALADLKARLGVFRERAAQGGGGEVAQGLTVMRGWPGIGKTTLVAELANDVDVVKAFPGGRLWASLGTAPDVLGQLDAWARALGINDLLSARPNITLARQRLAQVIAGRRILLLIDDVWEIEHGQALLIGGFDCATLLTTRETALAEALAARDDVYVLGALEPDASLTLLRRLCPQVVAAHEQACVQLARDLEHLPLALQVAGRLLRRESARGWDVTHLLEELRSATSFLDKTCPPDLADLVRQATPTIVALLQKSIGRLDGVTRARFALLGVVKEQPATFERPLLSALWETADPKETADKLLDRGLLEVAEGGRFTMHALLVAFARSMLSAN